jgi:hypothetical protein
MSQLVAASLSPRKGIKDVFYETRVLMGREYSVRRFAREVLGGHVDPVMVGYIEKGARFPSEALVRRLATIRKQDPHELLALLWRDRMVYAFAKELRRVLRAPKGPSGIQDAELAVRISQAIAALPDDGSWIPVPHWRALYRAPTRRRSSATPPISAAMAKQVEDTLRSQELVQLRGAKVRRRGRHFAATDLKERHALAIEFCTLFSKGLLDKLALAEGDTGTYLRNHYLHIEAARLPAVRKKLEAALRGIAEEFASGESPTTRFLNILVTATPF